MRCGNPIWLKQNNLKKGIEIPCGKCVACYNNKRNVWAFRIQNELDVAESARFVTLTYDEKYLPWINEKKQIINLWDYNLNSLGGMKQLKETLKLEDLQNFLKKCRNQTLRQHWNACKGSKIDDMQESIRYVKKSEKTGKWSCKMRYFACGEYGDEGNRPHYHIILYNLPISWYQYDPIHRKEHSNELEEIWGKGIVDIQEVTGTRAAYVAKYTIKDGYMNWDENDIRVKPFAVMSKKPGIGANYINDENRDYFISTKNYHTRLKGGYIQPLGRYYKEKIFEPEKKKYSYELEAEENRKIKGETNGIQIRKPEETIAKRKTIEYGYKKEKAEKEYTIGEEMGDIIGTEQKIRDRKRESFETLERRTSKYSKGQL